MDHMDKATLELQYRQIMEKAAEQLPGHALPEQRVEQPEAAFFFPWEQSPYRANGSTSAESNGANSTKK